MSGTVYGFLRHAQRPARNQGLITRITTKELIGLRVGDIIKTEKDVRSPLSATIEGVQKFLVHPGAYKGQKAIRVERAVEPQKAELEEA